MNSASVPVPELRWDSAPAIVEGARGGSTTAAELRYTQFPLAEAHQPTNRRIVDIISDVNRRTSERNALIFKSIAEREGGNAKRNMAYSATA